VFVDIDEKTFNIDPAKIEEAVTARTRAIIPIHIFGQPADMDAVMKVAQKHKLKVIEDACQAIGAEYKEKKVGTIGDFGCFSFFPTKNLGGAGDGGLITCKDQKDYDKVKLLRLHGAKKKYYNELIGVNSRLDALQAAVLQVKLPHLTAWNLRRAEIAKLYTDKLSDLVDTPHTTAEVTHVYHQYAVKTARRDGLLEHLNANGISAGVYYPSPLHLQPCFSDLGYKEGDLPVVEKICLQILSLPIYPEMSDEMVSFVAGIVRSLYK
jgi:dTDP-4-amino-4,6-dideoxygalactose transaminase